MLTLNSLVKIGFYVAVELAKAVLVFNCGCIMDGWVTTVMSHPYEWVIPINKNLPAFVAAPYSPLYYLLNQPQRYGYVPWMSYLFLFDILLTGLAFLRHGWPMIIFYSLNSVFFLTTDVLDFFTYNLSMLGVYNWRWSALAIIYKIPWVTLSFSTPVWFPFPPGYVWNFVLHDPYSYHESLLRVIQLVVAWLLPLTLGIIYYRKHRLTLPYGYMGRLWYRLRYARDNG